MKRAMLKQLTAAAIITLMSVAISSPGAQAQTGSDRIAGQDCYQTARLIGETFNSGKYESGAILASGRDFSDALSAAALSKKLNAPILLADVDVNKSKEAINYINQHVPAAAPIYIVGGTSIISSDFETSLNQSGYYNIKRLAGQNQFDTNMEIVNEINVPEGTPVFLASAMDFPDALSVSSFSGSMQYPTLLIESDSLSDEVKDYIIAAKPEIVYIAGGQSVISQAVESCIKGLDPNVTIIRLAGNNQYDTAAAVAAEFTAAPRTIYLANGTSFSDALAGSALAAKTKDPILLIDRSSATLPQAVTDYLQKLHSANIRPDVKALGGTAVVSDNALVQVENVLDGLSNDGNPITQRAILTATIAVEQAENSESQANINSAKLLVDALPDGDDKTFLLSRLEAVQTAIDYENKSQNVVSAATNAVGKAESSLLQADVNAARSLVHEISDDTTRKNLFDRLRAVQNTIDDIKAATSAVEKAEITRNNENINTAEILVNNLSNETSRYALLNRLWAIE